MHPLVIAGLAIAMYGLVCDVISLMNEEEGKAQVIPDELRFHTLTDEQFEAVLSAMKEKKE